MKDGKHVILCVDDDPSIRDALQIVLGSAGYEVHTAASAEEGFKLAGQTRPDLMIVDLMMEEIDAGRNLVRNMRAAGHQLPIFMLSSVGDTMASIADYHELGLAGLLQKPINPGILLKLVAARLK